MTGLLERHGQGGVGDAVNDLAYWSSFLVADPHVGLGARDLGPGLGGAPGVGRRRHLQPPHPARATGPVPQPASLPGPTSTPGVTPAAHGFADGRLAAGRAFVARQRGARRRRRTPRRGRAPRWRICATTARDRGARPEGAARWCPPPRHRCHGDGMTVCMHIRDFEATTASMVAELPADQAQPGRAWVALGSPCASVFVPVLGPTQPTRAVRHGDREAFPVFLADEALAARLAAVARAAERDAERAGDGAGRVRSARSRAVGRGRLLGSRPRVVAGVHPPNRSPGATGGRRCSSPPAHNAADRTQRRRRGVAAPPVGSPPWRRRIQPQHAHARRPARVSRRSWW